MLTEFLDLVVNDSFRYMRSLEGVPAASKFRQKDFGCGRLHLDLHRDIESLDLGGVVIDADNA